MAITQIGNSKPQNTQFAFCVDIGFTNKICMCFICKKIWDSPSEYANFKAHLIAEHGFTDAG